MSSVRIIEEGASRGEIVQELREWLSVSALRGMKKATREKASSLIDALTEGAGESWTQLSNFLLGEGVQRSLSDHPGLWSNIRIRSGKSWHAINTMTRLLTVYLLRNPYPRSLQPDVRIWPNGVGCVSLEREHLWIADHLHYWTRNGMETTTDSQFYGVRSDPDFNAMPANTHEWGYLQTKWFQKLGEKDDAGGWLNSPRYAFPVRAHRISRTKLFELPDEIGTRLWNTAAEISSLCPATITSEPEPWWHDRGLLPGKSFLGEWAASEVRRGHGLITLDSVIFREVADPVYLPALLSAIAPGRSAGDQLWEFIQLLIDRWCRMNASVLRSDALKFWRNDATPGRYFWVSKAAQCTVTTTDLIVSVLADAQFVPVLDDRHGIMQLPADTILRAGLWKYLLRYATPVVSADVEHNPELGNLEWAWYKTGSQGVPVGYQAANLGAIEEILKRPGSSEVGGNLTSKRLATAIR